MNSARHLSAQAPSISNEDAQPLARVRVNSRSAARHRAIYNPVRDYMLSRAQQTAQPALVSAPVTAITKSSKSSVRKVAAA